MTGSLCVSFWKSLSSLIDFSTSSLAQENRLSVQRAPLLWILVPYVLAIFCQHAGIVLSTLELVASGSFTWCLLVLCFKKNWHVAFHAGLCLNTFLLSLLYLQTAHHRPQKEMIEWDTPRIVTATLHLEKVFHHRYGIGRLSDPPSVLSELSEQTVWFYLPEENVSWVEGSELQVRGEISSIKQHSTLSDGFKNYLIEEQKVFLLYNKINILSVVTLGDVVRLSFTYWQKRLGAIFDQHTSYHLPWHSTTGQAKALILGDRSEMNREARDHFVKTGTLHLFAISGLHIGVVAWLLYLLMKRLPLPNAMSDLFTLLCLQGYVQLTGNAASAQRAFWMVFAFFLARYLIRKRDFFPSLVLAAGLILLIRPEDIFSTGFHLSFLVVGAIFFYALPLKEALINYWESRPARLKKLHSDQGKKSLRRKVTEGIITSMTISLSALLVSAPLVIEVFEIFSPIGILLNLLFVPLASLALLIGVVSIALSMIGLSFLSVFSNEATLFLLWSCERIADLSSRLPGSHFAATFEIAGWGYGMSTIITLLIFVSYRHSGYKKFLYPWAVFTTGMLAGLIL